MIAPSSSRTGASNWAGVTTPSRAASSQRPSADGPGRSASRPSCRPDRPRPRTGSGGPRRRTGSACGQTSSSTPAVSPSRPSGSAARRGPGPMRSRSCSCGPVDPQWLIELGGPGGRRGHRRGHVPPVGHQAGRPPAGRKDAQTRRRVRGRRRRPRSPPRRPRPRPPRRSPQRRRRLHGGRDPPQPPRQGVGQIGAGPLGLAPGRRRLGSPLPRPAPRSRRRRHPGPASGAASVSPEAGRAEDRPRPRPRRARCRAGTGGTDTRRLLGIDAEPLGQHALGLLDQPARPHGPAQAGDLGLQPPHPRGPIGL